MSNTKNTYGMKGITLSFVAASLLFTGCAFNPGSTTKHVASPEEIKAYTEQVMAQINAESEAKVKNIHINEAGRVVAQACDKTKQEENVNQKIKCASLLRGFAKIYDGNKTLSIKQAAYVDMGKKLSSTNPNTVWGCSVDNQEINCDVLADNSKQPSAEQPVPQKAHLKRDELVKKITLDKQVADIIMNEDAIKKSSGEPTTTPYIFDASGATGTTVADEQPGRFTVKLPDQGPSLWKQIVATNKTEFAQLSKGLSTAMDSVSGVAGNAKTWAKEQTAALSGAADRTITNVDNALSKAGRSIADTTQNLTEKTSAATSSFAQKAKAFDAQVASGTPATTAVGAVGLGLFALFTAAAALFGNKAKSPAAAQSIKQTVRRTSRKRQAIKKSSVLVTAFNAVAASLFGKKAESPFALDSIKQTVRRTSRKRPAVAARKPTRAAPRLNVNVVIYHAFRTFGLCAA